jgi:hypothetical protein
LSSRAKACWLPLVFSFIAKRIEVAKFYHFENDRRWLFHSMGRSQ